MTESFPGLPERNPGLELANAFSVTDYAKLIRDIVRCWLRRGTQAADKTSKDRKETHPLFGSNETTFLVTPVTWEGNEERGLQGEQPLFAQVGGLRT